MALQDDMADDLTAVFFSDFATTATINGSPVTGIFGVTDSRFVDVGVPYFEAPRSLIASVRQGDSVVVDGVSYAVAGREFSTDVIQLLLGRV